MNNNIIIMAKHSCTSQQQRLGLTIFALLIFAINYLAVPSDCLRELHHPKPTNHAALFVFGDSLFDPGNNNFINTTTDFLANFVPYGETFFGQPTGRFCNGRIIPDFIAEFAQLSFVPPFLEPGHPHQKAYGFNFASAGAGALAETHAGLVIDLPQQLKNFRKARRQLKVKLGKSRTKRLIANAVYLFSIGSNDYLSPSSLFKPNASQEYIELVIGSTTAAFEEIYEKGGRKFAILNLVPLGCLPAVRAASLAAGGNGDCVAQTNTLVEAHNTFLSTKLLKMKKQLVGFKYSYFDSFAAALDVQANPSKYGFQEVKSACCGIGPFRGVFSCGGKREVKEYDLCSDPQVFLFWDSIHPTEAANQLTAEAMWAGPPNFIGPDTLQTLFQLT